MFVGPEFLMVFLGVALGSYAMIQWFQYRRSLGEDRLRDARQAEGDEPERKMILGKMTPVLAAQVPLTEEGQKDLRPELREAGYYAPTALMEYAAVRSLLVLVPLVVAVLVGVFVPPEYVPAAFGGGVMLAAIGYAAPRAYLNRVAQWRKRQIERGLPVAVDMLALAITSGQTVSGALERVAQEMHNSFPELARELEIVRQHTRLRSLDFALTDWAERVRIPEVHQLVAVLTSSERLGKDVSTGLLEFSEHYRMTQRQRADAQANRASVLMLFPMLLGLWLPAAVILVAPILFEFGERSKDAAQAISKGSTAREFQMKQMTQMRSGVQARNPGPAVTQE